MIFYLKHQPYEFSEFSFFVQLTRHRIYEFLMQSFFVTFIVELSFLLLLITLNI